MRNLDNHEHKYQPSEHPFTETVGYDRVAARLTQLKMGLKCQQTLECSRTSRAFTRSTQVECAFRSLVSDEISFTWSTAVLVLKTISSP